MIRKRIVYLDFGRNSLRRVFFIKSLDGSGYANREEMEWFMQEVSRALMIPRERFNNIPEDVQ